MRTFAFILLVIFVNYTFSQELRGMKQDCDDYSDRCYYYSKKSFPNMGTKTSYLYIVTNKSGIPKLRFVVRYRDVSSLFIRKFYFNTGAQKFELTPDQEPDRYTMGGYVIEKLDQEVDENIIGIVKSIIQSGNCSIKCSGQSFYSEIYLNQREINAFKTVLEAFKKLGGTLPE